MHLYDYMYAKIKNKEKNRELYDKCIFSIIKQN